MASVNAAKATSRWAYQGRRTRHRRRPELALSPPNRAGPMVSGFPGISARAARCSGPGSAQSDTAATGMALLPFLAAGQTHKSKGPYQQTITKGLAWLMKQQRADGDLAGNSPFPMYSHGLATLALCEAYGMTHDEHVGLAAAGRWPTSTGAKTIHRRLAVCARRDRRHLRLRLANHGPQERSWPACR